MKNSQEKIFFYSYPLSFDIKLYLHEYIIFMTLKNPFFTGMYKRYIV